MKNLCNQLLQELELELSTLVPLLEEDPVTNCTLALKRLMAGYAQLRIAYLNRKLSREDEIDFFKNCKPLLTSRILYFHEVCTIEDNRPLGSEKTVQRYYRTQLKEKERFFFDNAEFYRYYKRGHHYLDEQFFVRHPYDQGLALEPFHFQMDPLFATSHDYKVAQILANEELQQYLMDKLRCNTSTAQQGKVLKWTGPKVGLIELAYALHTEGTFNHGASDIKDIVQVFSRVFDIEIGQFHRTFHEICNRKAERTKFLQLLSEKLVRRMDQSDEH